ncbi:MAG TPA: mucoidy inhibitor MuiA family protein [Lacipirellulaceae bacterium]|nr:mucoidy inhibitor MuiA family protein [Lacipirellulaceae bacterium]
MLRQRLALAALVWIAVGAVAARVVALEANGRVTHVTLYRGQAQVTRTIPIEGAAGAAELVIGNLPEQVVPDSLFAEGGDAIDVRAVRFRTRAAGEEPREEVRKLDEQILALERQIAQATKRQALLAKRVEYLAKLEGFVAPTAHSDLTKGVLDAEALERLTTFTFAQHEKIAEDDVALAAELRSLNERFNLLSAQKAEITSGAAHLLREAVVFLEKRADAPAELKLNYLVGNCGWSPSYTMRAGGDRRNVRVEYNALIRQLTGEDWTGVALTLSTASPALGSAGPGLAPFHVTLTSQPAVDPATGATQFYGQNASQQQVVAQLDRFNAERAKVAYQASNAVAFDERNQFAFTLNTYACAVQQVELNGDATAVGVLRSGVADREGPSLSYELRGGVSLASRTDQQMVRILQTEMPSEFYHVAVPVLTTFVYREAALKNASDEDLLAGPTTVYLDGRFVGQGEMPTVARGESFVVGFGADPQLRARRELLDKTDSLQGGNRETKFEYRLAIENFSGQPLPVRVLDRLPHAEHGVDIQVTLGKTTDPVSGDKLYQREERPMGLLRWDIEAPADAAGESARLIEYEYSVEYDRQYVVSMPESKQQLQEEFERLERGRRGGKGLK